jgi:hypothetical protein
MEAFTKRQHHHPSKYMSCISVRHFCTVLGDFHSLRYLCAMPHFDATVLWFLAALFSCQIVSEGTPSSTFSHPAGWHTMADIQRIRSLVSGIVGKPLI